MSFLLRCFLFFLLILLPTSFVHSENLTIITEEWPPFNYTENSELKGFSTEIVQLIMKDLNVLAKPLVLPSARGIKLFNIKSRAMFYSIIQTSERKPLYKWIGPFGEQSIYFFKKKNSKLKINSIEDAKKVKSICSRSQGLVFNMLTKAGFKNLDTGVSGEGIYLRALNDRCELAIGESSAGVKYWLKKNKKPTDALVQTSVKLISSPLYIAASKDIPDDEIANWQNSLDKIKASKEYSALVQKYLK